MLLCTKLTKWVLSKYSTVSLPDILKFDNSAYIVLYLFLLQMKFADMEKDQIVCISVGSPFQRPRDLQQDVEVRANWTRARKQHGADATDITVQARVNSYIDVSNS